MGAMTQSEADTVGMLLNAGPRQHLNLARPWVNIWQNAEEGEASSADFDASDAGKAVQASFDEVATCEPAIAQAWDGYFLRTGERN